MACCLAAKRCRRKIVKTVSDLGVRREHLRKWRLGATVRAASSGTGRQERDARATRYVTWRVERSQAARKGQRRARQRPTTPQATSKKGVWQGRAAGQRGDAGGEPQTRFVTWARGASIFGHGDTVQQCGPHRRGPEDQREAHYVVLRTARGATIFGHGGLAQQCGARRQEWVDQSETRATRALLHGGMARKTLGDGGRSGSEALPDENRKNGL